jgi:hypothetical protein
MCVNRKLGSTSSVVVSCHWHRQQTETKLSPDQQPAATVGTHTTQLAATGWGVHTQPHKMTRLGYVLLAAQDSSAHI